MLNVRVHVHVTMDTAVLSYTSVEMFIRFLEVYLGYRYASEKYISKASYILVRKIDKTCFLLSYFLLFKDIVQLHSGNYTDGLLACQ